MALLGQLTVGILGDVSGYSDTLSKAQKETLKFSKNMERTGRDISRIGYGFQDLGQSLTNKITKPAMVASGILAGMVGTLGFKRLVGMDNAQAKLKGLGVEGKQLEVVMEDVKSAVQGTTHTMADGADVAAGALAAGVKEGAELERYIKLVGDAATGSNRPMGEMAMIFNRVQGSGKLMTQELNMIEQGMPGFAQSMADNLADGSLEAFRDMVTNGEVGTEEFLNVMEDFAGGMSEAYAETWGGLKDNILANIGIIGEALLEGLFEDGKKGMAEFLDFLRDSDGLKQWATETGESIREFANTVVDRFKDLKSWWDSLSDSTQELTKKIALFGSIGAVAIGPVLEIVGTAIVSFGSLYTRISGIIGAVTRLGGVFGILTGPVGIAIGVITALVSVGVLLYKNWETVKEVAMDVFGYFEPLLDNVKKSFENLKSSAGPIMEDFKRLWESLVPVLKLVGSVIGGIIVVQTGLAIGVINGVINALGPLIRAIINLVDIVVNMVNLVVALLTGDFAGAWDYLSDIGQSTLDFFINIVDSIVGLIGGFVTAIYDFFHGLYMALVGNSIIPDMVNAIFEWFVNMYEWVIETVTNLVEGVIEFFTDLYEKVSEIFEAIWQTITDVLEHIKGTFENALNFILALVAGDFEGMKDSMNDQMENSEKLLTDIWENIKKMIGKKATEILTNVISKFIDIKNNITNKITEAKDNLIKRFSEMVTNATKKGAEVVSSVKDKFNEARDKIIQPIEKAKDKVSEIVDKIKSFFSDMKLSLPKITIPKLPKLPKPKITGSFSLMPPKVPKISWNAAGGIFNKPTIFNTANAGLQGVGEAGAEAILPLKPKVLAGIGEGIARTMASNDDELLQATLEQNKLLMQLLQKDNTAVIGFNEVYRPIKRQLDKDKYSQSKQRRR